MICRFAALKRKIKKKDASRTQSQACLGYAETRSSFYVKTNKNKEKNFLYIFAYFFLFFLYTPRRGMNRTKLFFYDY